MYETPNLEKMVKEKTIRTWMNGPEEIVCRCFWKKERKQLKKKEKIKKTFNEWDADWTRPQPTIEDIFIESASRKVARFILTQEVTRGKTI